MGKATEEAIKNHKMMSLSEFIEIAPQLLEDLRKLQRGVQEADEDEEETKYRIKLREEFGKEMLELNILVEIAMERINESPGKVIKRWLKKTFCRKKKKTTTINGVEQ